MPGEFENEGFTLKTHHMFSVHTMPGSLKTQQSPVILDLCLRKARSAKNQKNIVTTSLSKSSVLKMFFPPHENEKLAFSNSSGLKTVLEKLCVFVAD